ncbi:lipopolysaccharide biosynthesis protein [Cupriavidus plantarum]|uniref:lipopolysaccharide biosynthesis protein n=1 Tax=Cupriavidus plantarum TaxID=942865 RepID=UPI001B081BD0|nr:hypothetical protein [Cupriavidus plantarum]CAG2146562.1 hypothetical protein LMG26296_03999 [Cupriavidus plantarum]SMR86240.1 Membrane protein involved in the export of O-antigen and teichoic acid [Cupriavidus plantarum]
MRHEIVANDVKGACVKIVNAEMPSGATEAMSGPSAPAGTHAAEQRASEGARALRLAVASSMVSKVASVTLQLVSIPLFAKVLDVADFSALMVYNGISAWLALVAIGIWPTITAIAADDRKKNMLAGVVTASTVALSSLFVAMIVAALLLRPWLENSGINLFSAGHFDLFIAALACFATLTVLSIGEAVNQGQHRQHVNNLITAGGSLLNVICIVLIAFVAPSHASDVTLLFVASQLGFVLVRVINMVAVLMRVGRPCEWPGKAFAIDLARNTRSLVQAQLALAFIQQGTVLLCYEMDRPRDAALLALLYRANMLLHSLVYMINQPLWPIIHRHMLGGDWAWVSRTYRKLGAFYVGYGLLAVAGAPLFGSAAVSLWTSGEFVIPASQATLCAAYFAVLVASAASTPVLMGAQAFSSLGNIGTMELIAASVLCAALYLADAVTFPNMVIALLVANVATALWMMPARALGLLRRGAAAARQGA